MIFVWPDLLYVSFGMFFFIFLFFVYKNKEQIKTIWVKKDVKNVLKKITISQIVLGGAFFCSVLFLLASFLAPYYLSVYPLEMSLSSNIASSINGLMSPFIAIAAAILTFMAFWVQYNANQRMIDEDRKQQIERQFYEMLKIHNDNVKSFHVERSIPIRLSFREYEPTQLKNLYADGQSYLQIILLEFNYVYEKIKEVMPGEKEKWFSISYDIFYNGAEYTRKLNKINDDTLHFFQSCRNCIWQFSEYEKFTVMGDDIFRGHVAQLNSYYRHLFLIVKTIVRIDDKIMNYSEKRQFLRIVRAQLTSVEQVLLFYNWKSECGWKWEQDIKDGSENHFFTDYRMIHNINPDDCIAFSKQELLDEMNKKNKDYKYEGSSYKDDPLFELF